MATANVLYTDGPCVECDHRVEVLITRDGGLPIVDAHGYSGMTGSGDLTCRDHYCDSCDGTHGSASAFERCQNFDMSPPCHREEVSVGVRTA